MDWWKDAHFRSYVGLQSHTHSLAHTVQSSGNFVEVTTGWISFSQRLEIDSGVLKKNPKMQQDQTAFGCFSLNMWDNTSCQVLREKNLQEFKMCGSKLWTQSLCCWPSIQTQHLLLLFFLFLLNVIWLQFHVISLFRIFITQKWVRCSHASSWEKHKRSHR